MAEHHNHIAINGNPGTEKEGCSPQSETAMPDYMPVNNYPLHYEKKVVTRTGIEFFMRPIKPEDAPLLLDMHNHLSPRTKYYRFFSPLNELPEELLIKFTQVDYKKDMALIALESDEPGAVILAAARFITRPDCGDAEFAVVSRDEWQGKGIGRVLLENLILSAKEKEIECMCGYVLAENTHMLSLARNLGFHSSKIPGEYQYFIKIDLKSDAFINKKGV